MSSPILLPSSPVNSSSTSKTITVTDINTPSSSSSTQPSSLYYELLICIGTTLYGISVVTSRGAMNNGIGPATFNSLQHIVAAGSLILIRPLLKKLTANSTPENDDEEEKSREPLEIVVWFQNQFPSLKKSSFELIFLATLCATLNFIASTFNQFGLVTVEAGKSAFLTSLYVGFTPMILFLLHGSNAQINTLTWVSAFVSIFGSYLLAGCEKTSLLDSLSMGEVYTIIGALLWAFVILMTDYAVDRVECIDLVCLELSVSTIFCLLLSSYYEPDGLAPLLRFDSMDETFISSWLLILATGAIEAVAFLLDTIGQIHTSGSRAALLMGMDSVVTVVIAYIYLGERLTFVESIGCLLLLSSTLLTSLGSNDEEEEDDDDDELDEEEGEVVSEETVGHDILIRKIRSQRPHTSLIPSEYATDSPSMVPKVPYHKIKSTAEFAGELRKQRYVLLSNRRGLPARTGKRERSHSLHEHHPQRRTSKEIPTRRTSKPSTYLSSSLPNTSSIGYGLTGNEDHLSSSYHGATAVEDHNELPSSRYQQRSEDDLAIGTKRSTELTPLLSTKA